MDRGSRWLSVPRQVTRPGVRLQHAQRDPHRRGLAGPVRAEEAEHLAGGDLERQVVEGDDGPEPLGEVVDDEASSVREHTGVAPARHRGMVLNRDRVKVRVEPESPGTAAVGDAAGARAGDRRGDAAGGGRPVARSIARSPDLAMQR